MNELREICERMLAAPPPLRDSAEVLATARRSATRRRHAGLASAGALVVATAAVTLTLQLTTAGGSARPAPPAATTAPAPQEVAATTSAPEHLPPARAAATHAERLRQLLLPLVPPGYAVKDFPVEYDEAFDRTAVLPNAKHPAPKDGVLTVAFAGLLLGNAGGEGLLSADILAAGSPTVLAGDCATSAGPPATTCETLTVDGVRINVTTWEDESGRHLSALRPLDGGCLVVTAAQGMGSGESEAPRDGARKGDRVKPPLATLPFTPRQLADLAANPAMLQFP